MNVRPPTGTDFEDVLALVTAADLADVGVTDWNEKTLRDDWDELDLERDAWVVELDGRLAAYAKFENRGGGRLIAVGSVHPKLRGRGVGTELIDVTDRRVDDGGPDFHRHSFEEWSERVFNRADFDPSLLWVALEGEVVGVNVCAWKYAGDWSWIGTLGVLASHRGRGIGDALLRTAFAEFWRRGETRVALGVRVDNPSATGLYERAGMRVLWRITLYEKPL